MPEGRKAIVWMANVDYIGQPPLTRAALDAALGLTPEPIVSKRSAGSVLAAAYASAASTRRSPQYADMKTSQADLYELGEDELNTLGYSILREKKHDDALRVFKLNVEAFPKSANARDSLGEAYEIAGDTAAARAAYEARPELDPKLPARGGCAGKASTLKSVLRRRDKKGRPFRAAPPIGSWVTSSRPEPRPAPARGPPRWA